MYYIEVQTKKSFGVLVIAYKRHKNLEKIVEFLISLEVSYIEISIDGPKGKSDSEDNQHVLQIATKFSLKHPDTIVVSSNAENVGCAVNVINSCNSFFSRVEFGIILEDDCVPTKDFFEFVIANKGNLNEVENILLICGSQFAPNTTNENSQLLSNYALTWGWATNSSKWFEISNFLRSKYVPIRIRHWLTNPEYCFWKAAERRAKLGFTDVWDSILVSYMRFNAKYSILPRNNLIENIGNDKHATHTIGDTEFLNYPIGIFTKLDKEPEYDEDLDSWLKINFFHIRFRHLFSTKITWILDLNRKRRKFEKSLSERMPTS